MLQRIKIHGLGSSGEGVGKAIRNEQLVMSNGDAKQLLTPNSKLLTVFVEGALPGEEVVAEIETLKKNYAVARLIEVVKPSADRAVLSAV